jgi:hypothetical protein
MALVDEMAATIQSPIEQTMGVGITADTGKRFEPKDLREILQSLDIPYGWLPSSSSAL